jgi:hypothetical protein
MPIAVTIANMTVAAPPITGPGIHRERLGDQHAEDAGNQ